MSDDGPSLTVVIPTLDEEERLPLLLADLSDLDAEIVVVDGGSRDATVAIASSSGARVLQTRAGRAHQLRTGAEAAQGSWLAFIHADSRLDPTACADLKNFLEVDDSKRFAHFMFELDGPRVRDRFIEVGQRLREWLFGWPYGDQGLVVSRKLYEEVGGYPEWPIMEDVGIIDRLGATGVRTRLRTSLRTSSRRYEADGYVRTWLRHSWLIGRFRRGAPVDQLHRSTLDERTRPKAPRRRAVVAFAKAPTPGRVKTRLAADLGDQEAARIYREMGKAIVDRLRDGPFSLFVYVDPPGPDGLLAVSNWLGPEGLELRPQAPGDLGDRMRAAISERLEEADEVCVVGTDVPDLDVETAVEALDRLARHDVVLGPSTDGGYYLIATRAEHPELFSGVPWSTAEVLGETAARAASSGISVGYLQEMTDVDTLSDLPTRLYTG